MDRLANGITLVQTYRLHQTALYRREKLAITKELNDFALTSWKHSTGSRRPTRQRPPTWSLAEVENQTTVEQLEIARQEYICLLGRFAAETRRHASIAASAEPTAVFASPKITCRQATRHSSDWPNKAGPKCRLPLPPLQTHERRFRRRRRISIPSIGPVYERNESRGRVLWLWF